MDGSTKTVSISNGTNGFSADVLSLDGVWQLQFGPQAAAEMSPGGLARAPGFRSIQSEVPGNVELDLMRAGLLPDISVGERCYQTRQFETCEWWYVRTFETPAWAADASVDLVFEGIDTLASVWLNDQLLGRPENMLIAHRFAAADALRPPGETNELYVRIESAVLRSRQRVPAPGEYAFANNFEAIAIRKAPHSFGWDILPRLVSAGIWRGVRLEVVKPTRWRDMYLTTLAVDEATGTAKVLAIWDFTTPRVDLDDLTVRITLSDADGVQAFGGEYPVFSTHGRCTFDVPAARFWWPRGSGEQHLYEVTIDLVERDGTATASWRERIGLRTIELRRTELTTPAGDGEFLFVVNGRPTFMRGTNWVPLDALHSRDVAHLEESIAMIADLNCNMIRCWGGSVYEDTAFFDLCDENGLMVWQDFAMGCAVYPQDDGFAEKVRLEAEAVVLKFRNHPSLALWAGNNENDEAFEATFADPNTDRISRHVLPAVVRQHDPLRAYLPSSPYRPPAFFQQKRGAYEVLPEQHLWGPRVDFKVAFYTQSSAHFASEIGYHGCPNRETLEQMMEPGQVWPWQNNPQWLAKAVKPHPKDPCYDYRIPLMARQIEVMFETVPETLDDYVFASQASQAEAKKFFIEHFRRGKWRRTGILWWNLRDGWPVISDAIVDYYMRRKLAYAYIKRSQTDVCLMIGEPDETGRHPLVAVQDSPRPVTGHCRVSDADSSVTLAECDFTLQPGGPAVTLATVPKVDRPALWLIEWTLGEGTQGRNHYLAGPRPFDLETYRRWHTRWLA